MTSVRSAVERLAQQLRPDDGVEYPADVVAAPGTMDEAARLLEAASRAGMRIRFWGAGTHQGLGNPVAADLVVTTARMRSIIDWQPEDLTVVVEPGVRVGELRTMLADRRQSAVLPEDADSATVGGIVAAGLSGWSRHRYGPTRDRVLETVVATGDGRLIRAGGRVVKNVTGYDIPRLMTGSLGSLGMIGPICLKLWPIPEGAVTVTVNDRERALATAYRPLAIIESDGRTRVYLAGTPEEVDAQAAELDGDVALGLAWPESVERRYRIIVRVPSPELSQAIDRIASWDGAHYDAAIGVGEMRIDIDDLDVAAVDRLRSWAEGSGGALVLDRRPLEEEPPIDPWGTPPASMEIQRRVKAAFDPLGICNPGVLPGGL